MSLRKASVLAANLPPGSMVHLGTDMAWTQAEHFARQEVFLLEAANWQRAGGKGDKPKPTPTPSQSALTTQKQNSSSARAEAAMHRHVQRMEARRKREG